MKIELSIIIPIYNIEQYLDKCLSSIEAQCDSTIEVICIDDGSPDSCYQICKQYEARINNFTLIRQENAGVSAARNKGLELAVGDWIWFVDPDDWIEENAIHEIKMIQKDNCDVISFYSNHLNNKETRTLEVECEKKFINGKNDKQEIGKLKEQLISLSNPYIYIENLSSAVTRYLFRREYLLQHRCQFDKRLIMAEDVLFLLYVLDGNPNILFIDKVLYTYNDDNLTSVCHRLMPDAVSKLTPCLETLEEYLDIQDEDYSDAFRLRKRVILTQILDLEILHSDNKEPIRMKKKVWKDVLSLDVYRGSLKIVFGESLSLKTRVRYFLMRNNCLRLISIYYKMRCY